MPLTRNPARITLYTKNVTGMRFSERPFPSQPSRDPAPKSPLSCRTSVRISAS